MLQVRTVGIPARPAEVAVDGQTGTFNAGAVITKAGWRLAVGPCFERRCCKDPSGCCTHQRLKRPDRARGTQSAQSRLIREHTSSLFRDPFITCGICSLINGYLGSMGKPRAQPSVKHLSDFNDSSCISFRNAPTGPTKQTYRGL